MCTKKTTYASEDNTRGSTNSIETVLEIPSRGRRGGNRTLKAS